MRIPLEEEVLGRIRPREWVKAQILGIAERLMAAVDRSGIAQGMVVGSIARNTWLEGDRDLDIFMLFDPSLTRDELEERGLALAREIARDLGAPFREKYAEHPYISLDFEGLDVDLVPCYRVTDPREIKSAVDRTPFHTRYISERIRGLEDDVLLFKQFAKAGGFYGSDQMTEGFAGYLCELLILYYRGFTPLLQAASSWKRRTFIDIEGIAERKFEDPLVVIDPVDPNRNVAASVSLTRKFEFVELARGYLKQPTISFFEPPPPSAMGRQEFEDAVRKRGTRLYGLRLSTPPYIPEIVVPQLRKSLKAVKGLLERSGFVVNRVDSEMGERHCLLLFELMVDRLPQICRHVGPPVWEGENAAKFVSKYLVDTLAGPYIEEGLYIVEIPRRYTVARDLLASRECLNTGLGKHVKRSMEAGWEVLQDGECWSDEFAQFVSDFVRRSSPLVRIRRMEGGFPSL